MQRLFNMDINYAKKYEPIDGKWLITKELGSGSFGTVFEIVRKDDPDMKSALKIISIPQSQKETRSFREENYDMDEQSITSFYYGIVEDCVKEFKLMSQLRGNSNIVSYEDHDIIKKENEFGWDILIRMELLTPMGQYFAQNTLTTKDVIKLGIGICSALEVCQKYKIIHRDIKPSNIFISNSGEFKLGDFGVARTLEKASSGLSQRGTYTYMAPEVFRGENYGSNVDIYSLGIVMYRLLNNNMEPFRKNKTYPDSEQAWGERMTNRNIPMPANANGCLAEIVLKACAFDPKDRYESPIQMKKELESILYNLYEGKIICPNGNELEYESLAKDENNETISIFNLDIQTERTANEGSPEIQSDNNTIFFPEDTDGRGLPYPYDFSDEMFNDEGHQASSECYNVNSKTPKITDTYKAKPVEDSRSISELYKEFWVKYAKFNGCATRREFWITLMVNVAILLVLMLISKFIPAIAGAYAVAWLATFVPTIAITTRRLHDAGKSGHWQWLYFTVYGGIAVIVFLCQKSKYENNKYRNSERS